MKGVVEEQPKEIIDERPDYTEAQDAVMRRVYVHLAALIPEIGRDYTVQINFPDRFEPLKAEVTLKGLTKTGQAFCAVAAEYFKGEQHGEDIQGNT